MNESKNSLIKLKWQMFTRKSTKNSNRFETRILILKVRMKCFNKKLQQLSYLHPLIRIIQSFWRSWNLNFKLKNLQVCRCRLNLSNWNNKDQTLKKIYLKSKLSILNFKTRILYLSRKMKLCDLNMKMEILLGMIWLTMNQIIINNCWMTYYLRRRSFKSLRINLNRTDLVNQCLRNNLRRRKNFMNRKLKN